MTMGYGYADVFLVTFLTHPGVILPEGESIGGIGIPKFPTNWTALWQCLWYWILTLPAQRSDAAGWTMFVLYLLFLGAYLYFFAKFRIKQ